MATSLHFGPEWMRRGPGKSTSNANPSQANGNAPSSGGGGGAGGGGGGGASSESVSNRSMSPGRPSSNTSAQSGNGPVGALGSLPTSTRRNPSLGNLSHGAPAHLSTGTGGAPTLGSPAISSPGLFSFAAAAAAAGGGGAAGGGIGTAPSNVANSTSSTAGTGSGATSQQSVSSTHQSAANADADYKLLSLYGAEPQSNSQPKSPLPDAGKEHWSTVNNTERGKKKPLGGALERDRDSGRRSADTGPLSPALGGEPRGLNARAFAGSTTGTGESRRSGLFGRGQGAGAGVLNVTTASGAGGGPGMGVTSPGMPRERFSGIQGGVLGGVASARKRQDSEGGGNAAPNSRLSRPSSDDTEQGQDRRPSRARLSMGALGEVGAVATDAAVSSSPLETQPETPRSALPTPTGGSLSGRFKRDRIPGEGPIGPNADGSAGFGKFSSVGRKRERQSAAAAAAANSPSEAGQQDGAEHQSVTETDAAAGHAESELAHQAAQLSLSNAGPLDAPPAALTEAAADRNLDQTIADKRSGEKVDSTDGSAWSPETETWYYKDPSGTSQGPFPATTMQDWFEQSYFTGELPMRRSAEEEFRPLADILAALGHPDKPFLTPPVAATRSSEGLSDPPLDRSQQPDLGSSADERRRSSPAPDLQRDQQDVSTNALEALPGPPQDGRPIDQYAAFGTPHQQDPPGGHPWEPSDRMGPAFGAHPWPQSSFAFGNAPAPLAQQPFGEHHSPFLQHVQPPQSPFGAPGAFGAPGPRSQEEYLHMIRQRELQEQRHAAAAAAARAQAGAGLGFAGPPNYLNDAFGVRPGQGWNDVPGQWSHQVVHGLPDHQLPPFPHHASPFGAFNPQRQPSFESVGSPWRSNAVPSLPESDFGQHSNEQRTATQSFESQPPQADHAQEPIADIGRAEEAQPSQNVRGTMQDESENVGDVATQPLPIEDRPAQPAEATRRESADAAKPIVPQPATPPPPEPTPEELWPQSPSAVEFAAEPRLAEEAIPALANSEVGKGDGSETSVRNKRSRRKQQQAAEGVLGGDAKSLRGAEQPQAGGLKVLSREEFEKAQSGQDRAAEQSQAPLSSWLTDPSSASTPTASKAPWAKEQAETGAPQNAGLSLRQIQEAEERQAELRRAAERADAAQRLKTSSVGGDALPTTMRWGLASGHAHGAPTIEETRSATPTTAAAPVWNTSTSAPKKKTLMQIQEEEQKRAAKAKEAQAAQQAALQRGYADSATRQAAAAPVANQGGGGGGGGAWSVVGAKSAVTSGGPSVPSATRPVGAPAAGRTVSLNAPAAGAWGAGAAKTNGGALPGRSTVTSSPAVSKVKAASSANTDSLSDQPSAEFIKYLKEQLKGLNVKVEDFVEMLLSFPLDPSPDVVEIIAESVYANSSTMDGRRFAADFVAKRKMDAQGGGATAAAARGLAGGAGAGGSARGLSGLGGLPNGQGSVGRSASDSFGAVAGAGAGRAAHASGAAGAASTTGSAANDFGGFKVVKAKGGKKGGRA